MKKEKLAEINRNLRKKKELYLLLYHTSMPEVNPLKLGGNKKVTHT